MDRVRAFDLSHLDGDSDHKQNMAYARYRSLERSVLVHALK